MPVSICKHGAPFVVQHENRYGSGVSQSSLLSKLIRHISNSHEVINFISCYSANGSCFSNAQMPANASESPVIGYFGKINKLTANLDNSGRIFRPQHKLAARICYPGNRLLSGPIPPGFGLKHLLTCHSDGNVMPCPSWHRYSTTYRYGRSVLFPPSLLWEARESIHTLANPYLIKV